MTSNNLIRLALASLFVLALSLPAWARTMEPADDITDAPEAFGEEEYDEPLVEEGAGEEALLDAPLDEFPMNDDSQAYLPEEGMEEELPPEAAELPAQEIDPQVFDEELAPHGDWMEVPKYGRVWRPHVAKAKGWRPYTHGHWVHSRYGWTWASDYSWGWAPFHYGRWVYSKGPGWVWTKGNRWAPAWVAWRHGPKHTGWAPLPPGYAYPLNEGRVARIPASYYNFVPVKHVLSVKLAPHYVPFVQVRPLYAGTAYLYRPLRVNRYVWNGGPSVKVVVGWTGRPVSTVRVGLTFRAGVTTVRSGVLSVYRPSRARLTYQGRSLRLRPAATVARAARQVNRAARQVNRAAHQVNRDSRQVNRDSRHSNRNNRYDNRATRNNRGTDRRYGRNATRDNRKATSRHQRSARGYDRHSGRPNQPSNRMDRHSGRSARQDHRNTRTNDRSARPSQRSQAGANKYDRPSRRSEARPDRRATRPAKPSTRPEANTAPKHAKRPERPSSPEASPRAQADRPSSRTARTAPRPTKPSRDESSRSSRVARR